MDDITVTHTQAADGTETAIARRGKDFFRVVYTPSAEEPLTIYDSTLDENEPLHPPFIGSIVDDEGRIVLPLRLGRLPRPPMSPEDAGCGGYLLTKTNFVLRCTQDAWALLEKAIAALGHPPAAPPPPAAPAEAPRPAAPAFTPVRYRNEDGQVVEARNEFGELIRVVQPPQGPVVVYHSDWDAGVPLHLPTPREQTAALFQAARLAGAYCLFAPNGTAVTIAATEWEFISSAARELESGGAK